MKIHTCDELGVCQGLSPEQCPDCTSFECDVPCSPEPARPTFPFAPGTIEGPARPALTRHGLLVDLVWLLSCVGGLGMLVGYMLERFA